LDSRSERASEELNLTGICWVYERPTGDKIFYLSTRLQFGSAERTAYDTPSGDYRIQETLGQQAEPGTQFFQKYVLNADLPESIKRRLVERGPVFRNAKLDSAGFETSIPDSVLGHLDSAEDFALYNEIRDATHRFTAEALERIPDVPDVEATVRLRFETLRFLNPASGAWQVWLLGSVRAGDLTPSSADEGAILEATGRYAVLHEETLADGDLSPISIPAASIPEDAGLPLRGVFASPPGVVTLTTVVEDQNRPGTGAWAQDTIQVPSVGGLPQLSDIAIAQSEGGNWTRDGQTFLHVTPAHITNPDGSLHAYFECTAFGRADGMTSKSEWSQPRRLIGSGVWIPMIWHSASSSHRRCRATSGGIISDLIWAIPSQGSTCLPSGAKTRKPRPTASRP
jgi:hypothetical protein